MSYVFFDVWDQLHDCVWPLMHREFFSVCRDFAPLLHDGKYDGYGASRVAYYALQCSNEVRRVFARRTSERQGSRGLTRGSDDLGHRPSSGRQTSAYHDGLAHDVDACCGWIYRDVWYASLLIIRTKFEGSKTLRTSSLVFSIFEWLFYWDLIW